MESLLKTKYLINMLKKTLVIAGVLLTTYSNLAYSQGEKIAPLHILNDSIKQASPHFTPVFHKSLPKAPKDKQLIQPYSTGATLYDAADIRILPTADPQSEVHLSVDRSNPDNIIVSANTYTSNLEQGYYYSNNRGYTWTGNDNLQNSNPSMGVGGDPSTAYDANGRAYISTLNAPAASGYLVQSSTNKGISWSSLIQGATNNSPYNFDKEMIGVDDNANSPYANNFYAAWTDFNNNAKVTLNRSTTNGNSFSTPIVLSSNYGQGTNIQTGPNGEVYVCWADYGSAGTLPAKGLGFAKSLNGGVSFTAPNVVFTYTGIRTSNYGLPQFNNTRVNDFPAMAVDKSGGINNGRIYVVYAEQQNGNGPSVIGFRYSSDGGSTWSADKIIGITGVQQNWMPWICVDQNNGDIYVVYLSLDQTSGFQTDTYVAYSNGGGNTFVNQKVSDVSHITEPIVVTEPNVPFNPYYAGDYIGITAKGGVAYPAWADERNGTWQVYVSPVSVSDSLVVEGYYYSTGNYINNTLYTTNSVVAGQINVFIHVPSDTASTFTWQETSGNVPFSVNNSQGTSVTFNLAQGQSVTFQITSQTIFGTIINNRSFYVSGYSYVVSPNPASSYIDITPNNFTNTHYVKSLSQNNSQDIYEIKLYDISGRLASAIKPQSQSSHYRLNVEGLAAGAYILSIVKEDKSVESYKILIQK